MQHISTVLPDGTGDGVNKLPDRATRSPTPPTSQTANGLSKRYTRATTLTGLREPDACPECGAPPGVPGYLRSEALPGQADFGRLTPCPVCHADKLGQRLQQSSQLEGWLAGATFGGYRVTKGNRAGYDAAHHFAQKPVGWLTLWGDYGVGKTHLLAAVVNHLAAERVAAVYYTLPDLMDVLRDSYKDDFSGTFHRVVNVPVLAVDEVDKPNKTDWAIEKVYELFDARYRRLAEQGTLFAMNVQPQVTGDAWDYLYSRMHDYRNAVVEVGGGDVRPVDRQKETDQSG